MSRGARSVALQLDYYMSSQFAGIAVAMRKGLYSNLGIQLNLLPTCPPGEEAKVVSEGYSQAPGESLWVGSMEQNTLLPSITSGCKVKAVAAMFGRSPLCIAGLPGSKLKDRAARGEALRVGVHTDTEALMRRILPGADVRCLPRSQKLQSLLSGEIDAVQAYDVMETLRLAHDIGQPPDVAHFEGDLSPDVALGYAQVLFAPQDALSDMDHRETLRNFLHATFNGWRQVMQDPAGAAETVLEMQGDIDHWLNNRDFVERSTLLCCDYVKRARSCGEFGIIDTDVWKKACTWLEGDGSADGSLDSSVWAAGDGVVDAHPVAREVRLETQKLAKEAMSKHARPPKLVVVTVGSAPLGHTHPDAARRLQLFAPEDASWFSKAKTGAALGVEVVEVDLPESVTTQELVRELKQHSDADGVQLMWPLPPHIDPRTVYGAIPESQDVDGAHFSGRLGTAAAPPSGAHLPVACQGVLRLLDHYGVSIDGKRIVVIGRSWLVGHPLAAIMGDKGATVTLAHSHSKHLDELCSEADVVISAVGKPGLVSIDSVKQGAVVVNVGTAFMNGDLVPDIMPSEGEPHHVGLLVHSVGPISVAELLRNVAENAALAPVPQVGATKATEALTETEISKRLEAVPGWSLMTSGGQSHSVLCRDFWMPSYAAAVDFLREVSIEADQMDHHPNVQITHHCTEGATVTAEISTYAISALSTFDFSLASRMTTLYQQYFDTSAYAPVISMHDFTYDLPEDLIALYPAVPRHTSRLLVAVPECRDGLPTDVCTAAGGAGPLLDLSFSDIPRLLPPSSHLVANASRVLAARLFCTSSPSSPTASCKEGMEVMCLAPERPRDDPVEALSSPCGGQVWRCMIRSADIAPGAVLTAQAPPESSSSVEMRLHVERVYSPWREEGEDDGVEAAVRLSPSVPSVTAQQVFDAFGWVPLPPYMRRAAEDEDRAAYQTVYALENASGSVAAPTAGLHFSPEVLSALTDKGVRWSSLALHVGAGTFRPVTADRMSEHEMHSESFAVSVQALEDVIASLEAGRPLVLVGTTTVRTLESLYWLAVAPGSDSGALALGQWDAYRMQAQRSGESLPSPAAALGRLCARAARRGEAVVRGKTSLCIVPGYRFQLCDALITNFHQPDSTLLLLVAALTGRAMLRDAYEHAKLQRYRFLSYGDSTLFFNTTTRKM